MFSLSTFYCVFFLFFFNDTATTEIYTLSLHDALPIFPGGTRRSHARFRGQSSAQSAGRRVASRPEADRYSEGGLSDLDRKSTRLNSSHSQISYAVFCLKKKKNKKQNKNSTNNTYL